MTEKNLKYKKIERFQPSKELLEKAKKLTEMSKSLKDQVNICSSNENETIYISGKITGEDLEACRSKFKTAEVYLKESFPFAKIINPLESAIKEFGIDSLPSWEKAMIYDLKLMLDCTVVFFLSDYSQSNGAMIEHNIASKLNFIIIYQ